MNFLPGETLKTFTVRIQDNVAPGGDKSVNLTLSGVTGNATLGTPSTAVLNILDNDSLVEFAAASYLVNRMRDCGILVSTDGPDHNVIKIKPPLCFSTEDADLLVAEFDRILGEDAIHKAGLHRST